MYDVIIVGAGPAGSTVARILDKSLKVLLIDKRNLNDNSDFQREKCCGGLLAPAAQKALAGQGLGIPFDVLTGPQTFSVKSIDFDNNITEYYQRHYININREKFDRWMVSLVPAWVETKFSCVFRSYTESNSAFEVELEENRIIYSVQTRILIGADGAVSRIRDKAFSEFSIPKKYISIQEHFKATETLPYYVSIFDENVTDFYSWIIQKEDRLYLGTAIPDNADAEERYQLLVEKLHNKGLITGNALKRTGTIIMRPAGPRQLTLYKNRIALAGEAAGLISPSSAEGISYALLSGAALAESLNRSTSDFGRIYNRKLLNLKLNLIFKRLKVILMYNKLTRKLIMKSKILAMEINTENTVNK